MLPITKIANYYGIALFCRKSAVCNRGDWGSVLVCLKPKSVVAESDKSIGVKNLFVKS